MSATASRADVDVDKILDTLGWEGQIGQMAQIDVAVLLNEDKTDLDPSKLEHYIGVLGVGSVLNNVPWDTKMWKAADFRHAVMQIQATAKKHNRPPVIWGLDSVHGANYVYDALLTPQPLNLASTFNTSWSHQAGVWASRNTRQAGIPWLFSPLLGLSWNSFWSRTYETFGEDPLLVGDMAQAMIQGIQDVTDDDILPSSAAACGKHWLGYSFPHNGHDRAPSWIPRRHLYQYFLQPWRKVLQPSSNKPLLTIMESYSEMDGVPNVANRETLTKVLRRELGFEGMLVTDYHEIFNLYEWHHTAADRSDALKQSMTEGSVDMSMIANEPEDFFDGMKKLDAKGFGARIRESARRVLQLKQNLNMFEESFDLKPLPNDNKNDDKSTKSTISEKDLNIALEMTQQSIILTENKNNALPLNPQDDLKILITGPTSRSISFQSGGWTGLWQGVNSNTEDEWFTYGSTVLDAFQKEASSNGMWHITYECGTDNLGNDCQAHDNPDDNNGNLLDTVEEWVGWKDGHHEGIDSAINQAKNSDVVIVCLGEENYTEKPGDIRDLRLPTGQYELVTGIRSAARDQKIILVYFGGRPRLLDEAVSQVDAVLLGFLPGPLAGDSVAGIVSGRVNPNGRLPITYPKNQDLGGVPYLHAVSDMCTEGDGVLPHWNNVPCEVQWPFGHGLEYSQFEYSDIILNTDVLQHSWEKSGHSDLTASVTITNTGVMGGSTAILFFSFDEFRSTTPEYKRLRAYEKVWLEPGASKEVTVTIPLDDLKFVGPHDDSHYIFQDGLRFRVGVGASADCRADPGSNRCSDPVTIKTDKNYIAACEAACDLWEQSGCKTFTRETCRKECSSIHTRSSSQTGIQLNNDGWGWTYVSCLESLIWSEAWDSASCWKMTKLCRDVVNTAGMDELGAGAASRGFSPVGMSMAAIAMSLFAGIFAAVMIHLAIKGHFALKDSTAEFEAVATIEFV